MKNEHSVEKSVSMIDTVFLNRSEQPFDCGVRKEKAPISPEVSLPALSMLYIGIDGNLQKAPRTCL